MANFINWSLGKATSNDASEGHLRLCTEEAFSARTSLMWSNPSTSPPPGLSCPVGPTAEPTCPLAVNHKSVPLQFSCFALYKNSANRNRSWARSSIIVFLNGWGAESPCYLGHLGSLVPLCLQDGRASSPIFSRCRWGAGT